MSVALNVFELGKSFLGLRYAAVNKVSFTVAPGEIVVLLGPSGCGKTTTLRMVAGLEQPTAGNITIGDRTVSNAATGECVAPEHREIGMVFQSYAVWPHMTVFNNVAYPLRHRSFSRSQINDKVMQALETVGLERYATRSVIALSGGQMQRVALARALVYQPRILLLDEPLSNLDAKLRIRLRDDLRRIIKGLGLTALYVTHDQEEAVVIGDRIGVMQNGNLLQINEAVDLYNNPADAFVADFTGASNVLHGRVTARNGRLGTVVLHESGQEICALISAEVAIGDSVLVTIRPENLSLTPAAKTNAANQFCGRVSSRQFHGNQSVYSVDVFRTNLKVVELGTVPRFAPGADVMLTLPPEICRVFREATPHKIAN